MSTLVRVLLAFSILARPVWGQVHIGPDPQAEVRSSLLIVAVVLRGDQIVSAAPLIANDRFAGYGCVYGPPQSTSSFSAGERDLWTKAALDRANALLPELVPSADIDCDGNVTPDEARAFRRAFEFGICVACVIERVGIDTTRLAGEMNVGRDEMTRGVLQYRTLVSRLSRPGWVKLPVLPLLK